MSQIRSPGYASSSNTGSEVSIIPPSKAEWKNRQDTFGLLVVNNSPIVTYGTRSLILNLGLRHTFQWEFMITNVRNPILVPDFLKHYRLVVDMHHRQLLGTRTLLFVQVGIFSSPSTSRTLLPKKPSNDFMAIMIEFPTITQPCSNDCPIKHNITHHINTTGPPVSACPQMLAPEWLKIARQELTSTHLHRQHLRCYLWSLQ